MITVPLLNRPLPSKENINFKVKYALPFKGEWVVLNGGIEKKFSHSWRIHSQRYAYDFLKIDKNMKSHINDPKNLDHYYCYDEEINSPADGKVVKVVDKFQDIPLSITIAQIL